MVKNTRHDKINTFFLVSALILISVLTYYKWQEHSRWSSYIEELSDSSGEESLSSGISNREFHEYVKATGYVTWRERIQLWPNWRYPSPSNDDGKDEVSPSWIAEPDSPTEWLTEDDIDAFRSWRETCYTQLN